MIRLVLSEADVAKLELQLAAAAPEEDGAFFLLRESHGVRGTRLVAGEMIPPPEDAWERQAEGQLRPSAQWLSAVISAAVNAEAGLLFVHSHPGALHPAELSAVDELAVESLGETLNAILEGPFAATVVHEDSWAGVLWEAGKLRPLDTITSLGRAMRFLSRPAGHENEGDHDLDTRQHDALGAIHERLRELTVGVVGCGGLGSPLAEQLVRMGVGELILIDEDVLDTDSNVRRLFGSTHADLEASVPPPKVDVVGRHLETLGLGSRIRRVKGDVKTTAVFRHLLDADVVLGATDTHGSRAVINDLPSTYLLPLLDIGVRVGNRGDGTLAGLVAELRLITPERPCLWCRGAINADAIRAENLPPDEREKLHREGYLTGAVGAPAPSVAALTVLASGMAACGLIGVLSSEGPVLPSGWILDGLYGDAFETATDRPKQDCRCRAQIGLADSSPPPLS
jgi:molybdopterin/thiamine biosynthesis adenylyltransferase